MNPAQTWQNSGGALPWGSMDCHEVEVLLRESSEAFKAALTSRAAKVFDWATFSELDAQWMRFDAVHRMAIACEMLGFPGFGVVKMLAESLYDKTQVFAAHSRVLAGKLKSLAISPKILRWQKNAIESSSWGQSAYARVASKKRVTERQVKMEGLEKSCEQNIGRSILASPVWTRDRAHLKGLPLWLIELAKSRARERAWTGWLFFSNYREYRIFMASAESREMRQLMYKSRSRAGSEFVPGCDNAMLAKKILSHRKAEAKEVGHESYAHYVLAGRMLEAPDDVEKMLLDVAKDATPSASAERLEIDFWMKSRYGVARLEPWDYRFARAGLLRDLSGSSLSDSENYFSPIGTIERSVKIAANFLGISTKRDRSQEVDDLMVFRVFKKGVEVGALTIVPRLRGSGDDAVAFEWMLAARAKTSKTLASSMVFLQFSSSGGRLVNLSHGDVVTLFHELGHAFHSILGEGRYSGDSPIGIEGDALEFHSQLMEQLAWEPKILCEVGRYKGKAMSMRTADGLSKLRNFHAGAWTISQVTDALCDLRLHTNFKPNGRLLPWEIMVAVKSEVGLDRVKPYNRQAQQLGTFTGSYVCSDYCYLWSEGMARKVFDKWLADCKRNRGARSATEDLRKSFFEKGSRSSMMRQIVSYVGERPNWTWIANSRGFYE